MPTWAFFFSSCLRFTGLLRLTGLISVQELLCVSPWIHALALCHRFRSKPPVLPPPLTPLPLRWLLPIHLSTTLTSNTGYVFSSSTLGFSTVAEARNNTVSIQHSYIHNSEAGELSFPTVDSTQCKRKAGRVILSPFLLQPAC